MKQLKHAKILRLANVIVTWSVIDFRLPSVLYYIVSFPIAPALTNWQRKREDLAYNACDGLAAGGS
jgi:hypothetical protein